MKQSDSPHHVLVLYSIVDQWARGEPHELVADHETVETARAVTAALATTGVDVACIGVRTLNEVAAALAGHDRNRTVVFNLCEALGPTSGGENAVPAWLDAEGFCYVGGNAANLAACLDKMVTKQRLAAARLPTAPAQLFVRGDEPCTLPFPLLVKTLNEDSSVGLSPKSLVWNEAELRAQVDFVLRVYHQPAFAERFLRGREFYVSLWDRHGDQPELLAISQADYSAAPQPELAFDHFEAKWQSTYPAVCPAPISADLAAEIRAIAQAAYCVMGCRDYGRVDLREDEGIIYLLEVNPNPALHPDAGFAKAACYAGFTYDAAMAHLVQLAWQRRKQQP